MLLTDRPRLFIRERSGRGVVVIEGDWTTDTLAHFEGSRDGAASGSVSECDFARLGRLDSAGALAILSLVPEAAHIEGLPDGVARLFALVAPAAAANEVSATRHSPFLVRVGKSVLRAAREFAASVKFFGELETTLARSAARPRRLRAIPLASVMQQAGFDALPIIAVMTFFIGAVVALVGSDLLEMLGASALVVQLVGISVLREFGVLIPAILLAGRSASTFAAQIGAMRMNQETDAMSVMGVDLFEALVVPRVLALLITMPLLAFVAMLAGLSGGMLVSWAMLDVNPTFFIERLLATVDIRHFWVGMAKIPVLSVVIAVTGCRHGLAVEGDVEVLGTRVTTAVVQALFAIIFLDAAFALMFNELEL